MRRENINDILVFPAVAQERSFTRAGARLGLSQSAVSHIVRGFEARMGVRLLGRTTRSVSPTGAGQQLLDAVAPRPEEIDAEIAAVSEMGDKASRTIRITAIDHVISTVLWPRWRRSCRSIPTCAWSSAPTTGWWISRLNGSISACDGATWSRKKRHQAPRHLVDYSTIYPDDTRTIELLNRIRVDSC